MTKQNSVTTSTSISGYVPIADLERGQLFSWKSSLYSSPLIGICTVNMHGEPMGVMFYEGTYLTSEVKVLPLPAGTAVAVVAG